MARKVLIEKVRGVQRCEAALRMDSAVRERAAAARGMALGGARSEPASPPALFLSQSLEPKPQVMSSAVCLGSPCKAAREKA